MLELLVLVVIAVVLLQMRKRIAAIEERMSEIEHRSGPHVSFAEASPAAAPEPVWQEPPAPFAAEPADEPEPQALAESAIEPEPEHEPVPALPRGSFGFEDLFGRRLPIWAGGITLAVAGVLIVKYSIDAGLLSPLVRVLSGVLFGGGLIAAAEVALRNEARVRDARVRQALAGAGIASLYATILVAANVYGLIGPSPAFLGMAAVTGLAMALSLRFGAPSALLGLVGGLAAPALVGSPEPNIPLLSLYLALAAGGLSVLSRRQRWMWLGVAALVGGLGWGAVLLVSGALDVASSLSVGLYIILIGIAFPLMALPGAGGNLVKIGGSIAAAAQMAALVATGGFALLHWGLFGLVSIAIVWLSRCEPLFERLPAIGLGIGLLLLAAWPVPAAGDFALVMLVGAAIYAGPALVALWRKGGGLIEAGQIAAVALGGLILSIFHFYRVDHSADLALAMVSAGAALLPAGAAMLGWRNPERSEDLRFALLVTAAALLLAFAIHFAAPSWVLSPAVAGIGALLLLLRLSADDPRLEPSAWAFAAASLPLLAMGDGADVEWLRLIGEGVQDHGATAVLRWAVPTAVAILFAWKARWPRDRMLAQAAAALLGYGAVAQVLPGDALAIATALGVLALAVASQRRKSRRLRPAMAALCGVAALWALPPLLNWLVAAFISLSGEPVFTGDLPSLTDTSLWLLLPALLIGAATWVARRQIGKAGRVVAIGVAVAVALAAHIWFKQIFRIDAEIDFIRFGLAERTTWEALLLAGAAIAWRFGSRNPALALWAASMAHFGWYSLLLHNPFWEQQAVGSLPLLNLLPLAYGVPLAGLWLMKRHEPELSARFGRALAILQMLLVALVAFSLLRQAAEGSILSSPGVSPGEDIARSVLAIGLAIGFLLWGIARGSRDWRIGSLVLMIAAVAKVFLLDAAGLDGLMRIASFVALGVSLIGIGWLYSRHLARDSSGQSDAVE